MVDSGRVFVGIDWATKEHQACALDSEGKILGEKAFSHSGEGLASLADWVAGLAGSIQRVSISFESTHGAVVETLLERGAAVYGINPKQLDRFRDRFSMSGAKDDRRDALVLADSLRTDERAFRVLAIVPELMLLLRECSRMYDEKSDDVTRHTNRLRELLWRYFPQLLKLGDLDQAWILALWKLIPTPEEATRTSVSKIAKILKEHRVRRFTAQDVHKILSERPFQLAPGSTKATAMRARDEIEVLELLLAQRKECKRRISDTLKQLASSSEETAQEGQKSEQHDVKIILSLPGAGTIVLAVLLAEAHEALQRRDYQSLRTFAGVAPVTRQSGKSKGVFMRRACNPRLRNACYHWARVAMQRDPHIKAKYRDHRAAGKDHGTTLRILADYLLKVLCAMLREGSLYDPKRASRAA